MIILLEPLSQDIMNHARKSGIFSWKKGISFCQLILAERYTTNELANLHMEWQKQFREALNSYLDMSVFMQQSIYEIYSQTRLR